jgi:hypothetical protein
MSHVADRTIHVVFVQVLAIAAAHNRTAAQIALR